MFSVWASATNDAGPVVEWAFTSRADGTTFVAITNSGLPNIETALDSKGGFTFLLAGLKAYLEHHVNLDLVADAHPR